VWPWFSRGTLDDLGTEWNTDRDFADILFWRQVVLVLEGYDQSNKIAVVAGQLLQRTVTDRRRLTARRRRGTTCRRRLACWSAVTGRRRNAASVHGNHAETVLATFRVLRLLPSGIPRDALPLRQKTYPTNFQIYALCKFMHYANLPSVQWEETYAQTLRSVARVLIPFYVWASWVVGELLSLNELHYWINLNLTVTITLTLTNTSIVTVWTMDQLRVLLHKCPGTALFALMAREYWCGLSG